MSAVRQSRSFGRSSSMLRSGHPASSRHWPGWARDFQVFAAQWLAYVLPCRRFTDILVDADARLGVYAVRYSFIAVDFHHLLFAYFDRRTVFFLLSP
jgi:hypothetical protein